MAKSELVKQLHVTLRQNSYPIYVGTDLFKQAQPLSDFIASNQVMIVSNETVAPLYLENLQKILTEYQCDTCILPDGEQYKTQQSLFAIIEQLITKHHHRDTTLITLGGGVVGDITGFAASCYQRGVNFIQIPTSLLAQVDASIGGKTAINYGRGKNIVGAFYQPQAVFIDIDLLKTLPLREFRAGLAEVIKHAIITDMAFFEWLEQNISGINQSTADELIEVVEKCCLIKGQIVALDEKETGCRALLNLGHTFAHALEAYTDYTRWLHGEAVAIGLHCAALMSHRLGNISETDVKRIKNLLEKACLPTQIPTDINIVELIKFMEYDKKISNNKLRFILLKSIGECYIDAEIDVDLIEWTLTNASST